MTATIAVTTHFRLVTSGRERYSCGPCSFERNCVLIPSQEHLESNEGHSKWNKPPQKLILQTTTVQEVAASFDEEVPTGLRYTTGYSKCPCHSKWRAKPFSTSIIGVWVLLCMYAPAILCKVADHEQHALYNDEDAKREGKDDNISGINGSSKQHDKKEIKKDSGAQAGAAAYKVAKGLKASISLKARDALDRTENLALYMQHHQITPAHFMTVLLEIQGPSSVANCVENAGGNVYELKKKLSEILVKLPMTSEVFVVEELTASPQVRQVALRALAIAQEDGKAVVSLGHLIMAVLELDRFRNMLQEVGTDVKTFLESITSFYEKEVEKDLSAQTGKKGKMSGMGTAQQTEELNDETVTQFGIDLTGLAERGALEPVFGRNREIREVVTVLSRKGKGNPCLIGEPGVGKTAVAEGLAQRIIEGMTPTALQDKRLFSVDLGALVAGATHRGEFEGRLKKLLNYVVKSKGRIIMFIDEIHMILGAGKTEGSMDAANLLKPPMARGEIRILGATTQVEYKIIEEDAALERRFKPILVEEPPTEKAIVILQRLKPVFEKHHDMKISDKAITAAVLLSHKYVKHRRLPDKAIDLVDEACASKKVLLEMGEEEEAVPEKPDYTSDIHIKQVEIDSKRIESQQHPEGSDAELKKLEHEIEVEARKDEESLVLSADDVASVVSAWTGIPAGNLTEDEKTTVLRLAESLGQRIIGQSEASKAVADAILRSRVGLSDESKPIGSFLFLGPSGVGKTELAKTVAAEIFHNKERLVKIDMAEYADQTSLSRLIGASPGYIGYKAGGKLTEAIRRRPHSVVLFDEIEKGHPSVLDILLQLLDEGRLTDGRGIEVDFSHCVVILTSNVGAQYIIGAYEKAARSSSRALGHFDASTDKLEDFAQATAAASTVLREPSLKKGAHDAKSKSEGASWKEEAKEKVLAELTGSGVLRQEVLNRISAVVIFEPMGPESVKKITMLEAKQLSLPLKKQGIELLIDDSAADFIARRGYTIKNGARLLRKFMDDYISAPLAPWLVLNWVRPGMRVQVTASRRFKDTLEAHVCVLVNGKCDRSTRKARVLSVVPQGVFDKKSAVSGG